MAPTQTFTAVIRWRGPDPSIEIETRHSGFKIPEDAALFANAFTPNAPLGLRLHYNRSCEFLMSDGRYLRWYGEDITVWALAVSSSPETQLIVANDNDFEAHPFPDFPFPRAAYGDYEQAQYGVLDNQGAQVNVVLDWDERDHLRVTVEEEPADAPVHPDFFLGTLPNA